jgi:hypothetical protein
MLCKPYMFVQSSDNCTTTSKKTEPSDVMKKIKALNNISPSIETAGPLLLPGPFGTALQSR